MARYQKCIQRLQEAAGRELTDKEIDAVFARIDKASRDIRAGRIDVQDVTAGGPRSTLGKAVGDSDEVATLIQRAADNAAKELEMQAIKREQQAYLNVLKLGARKAEVDEMIANGVAPLDAVERTIARDYSGRVNVQSLEQLATGYRDYYNSQLLTTWDALGTDYLGFFQDKAKMLDLVRELRGEESGNPLAKKGAKAFHDVAERARKQFNENGGSIGRLDDWGKPQHHSQEKVADAGNSPDRDVNQKAWVEAIMPMLDRARYVDEMTGKAYTDAEMVEFLGKAWESIATNGHAKIKAGTFQGPGARANRHAEHRQIHFKDAESEIAYWEKFGEQTLVEILTNHIDTMARDIAFVEQFGPNPNQTYRTLRDSALKEATTADPRKTVTLEGRAVGLDNLWNYASGNTKPTYRRWLRNTADGIAHLNVAGKLGGAALASFFGDKPMMEAVSSMNNLPALQRWTTELSLLNPANTADRRLLQTQGLMVDAVRSGLQRFYEGLGQSSTTGRLANAVMRISGMTAINDIRKGAFGLSLMSAVGNEIQAGRGFDQLKGSDVRMLRNWGITKTDWDTWRLAKLDRVAGADHVLTSESIAAIPDQALRDANVIGKVDGPEVAERARQAAILKLIGAVNTESEFAIVTPGWRERAQFYGAQQRGTILGEVSRSVLQFKSFPWAFLQRGMDAVTNMDAPSSKAIMVSYLILSTTVAGAMLMQVRDMLAGKDPRKMWAEKDSDKAKFWGAAFLQGGALGIYGDFLYGANQTRYGSGVIEAMSGPTLGPIMEVLLVQPSAAIRAQMEGEGKDTHLAAKTLADVKGFAPGSNIWYARAAMDHLVWQRAMEALSPGYLSTIRQRTLKDYSQQWWWQPGETTPERAPDLGAALAR